MKIITVSGLDGSGKSTQIELLKNHLTSLGKKVFYFHAVEFSIANKKNVIPGLTRNLDSRFRENYNISMNKSVTKAGWLKIWLRKIALGIDLIRFKKLVARLEKEGYDYLISDRYFYDSVVNIEYLCGNILPFQKGDVRPARNASHNEAGGRTEGFSESAKEFKSPSIPLLQRGRIIEPDLAIYLKTSPEIIMQRERVPDQGMEYLKKKYELYNSAAELWNLKIVDGNRSKEEIFEEIIQKISN